MSEFFDCRLCFFFDIRVKLDLFNMNNFSLNDITTIEDHDTNSNREENTLIIVDFDCEVDNKLIKLHDHDNKDYNESNIAYDSDNNNDFNTIYDDDDDSDNDLSLRNNVDENCDTDDECTAEFKETRSFLYQYFTIYIVLSSIFEKLNTIFIKITLLYIKDEDNYSRM